jgi:hypothetical protein
MLEKLTLMNIDTLDGNIFFNIDHVVSVKNVKEVLAVKETKDLEAQARVPEHTQVKLANGDVLRTAMSIKSLLDSMAQPYGLVRLAGNGVRL